jgi:hypothetical protein
MQALREPDSRKIKIEELLMVASVALMGTVTVHGPV